MTKKVILRDDNGKNVEVDLKRFTNNINRYHHSGTSIHDENGNYFTINEVFRKKLKKIL